MTASMDSDAIEEIAGRWFARKASEKWTVDDQVELDEWLQASIAHRIALLRIETGWKHAARLKALGAGVSVGTIPARGSWNGFESTDAVPVRPNECPVSVPARTRHGLWRLAAGMTMVLLVAGLSSVYWRHTTHSATYRTALGRIDTISLSDGSLATLNTDTHIDVDVNESVRRVELDHGEVFFQVTRDARRPFIVRVGDQQIVVLGTSFSVRRDGEEVRVAVTEGRVKIESVDRSGAAPSTQLEAGSQAITAATGVLVTHDTSARVAQELSWRSGYLTFQDTSLEDAVNQFNRYTAKKIVIEDPQVRTIRIGGHFRSDNVDAFLWLLKSGFPVRVEEHQDQIVLSTDERPDRSK